VAIEFRMRLNLIFLLLLVTASTSVGVVWQSFEAMRSGDIGADIVFGASAAIGLTSSVLLGRIILKVSAANRVGKES
jgi:hypothetical protein